jgi:lipopolysaccharide cholinephosphotransferase
MEYILKTNPDGSVVTVSDVHKVLLGMLKDIDEVCRKHDIPYFLNAGSALGAFRHHGFIPWDDDADIAMMRSDYMRLHEVVHELGDAYIAHSFETYPEYNVLIPAMKIRKKGTFVKETNTLLENKCKDSDGIFVDVFVYDYVNKNKLLDLPLRLLNQGLMPVIVLFENLGFNPLLLKKWFVFNAVLYGKINRFSEYVGFDLTWTFKNPLKPLIFRKTDIYPVQYVKFEDTTLPIANRPHEFLCAAYDNTYMTPPPEGKRAPKHIVDIQL